MDAAALLALISGVGLGFGWQPMPDGSPQYEYIVQVEPQLLETMAAGQSIPIVADVPEHVHPIGRIRVMVGEGELPRQRLVTRLKPVAEPAATAETPDAGVAWAQYQPGAPSAYERVLDDRYAARQAPTEGASWNGVNDGVAPTTEDNGILPTGRELFDRAASAGAAVTDQAWNGGEETAAAARDALSRAGDDLRNVAQPLREGVEQGLEKVDGGIRDAAGNLGDRTRAVLEELDDAVRGTGSNPSAKPSSVASTGQGGGDWNTAQPEESAGATSGGQNWNQSMDPPVNVVDAGAAAGREAAPWNAEAPLDQRPTAAPATRSTADNFANAADPRLRGNVASAAAQPNATTGSFDRNSPAAAGAAPPRLSSNNQPILPNASGSTAGPKPNSLDFPPRVAVSPPLDESSKPKVLSPMLNQPANRPLEGVDPHDQRAADPSILAEVTAAASTASPSNPTSAAKSASEAAGQGWDDKAAKQVASADGNSPAARNNAAIVIAAWVLLTGSVAGNLYLFWSYLDVRQKYRSLVRKTARAVGSRFSAA